MKKISPACIAIVTALIFSCNNPKPAESNTEKKESTTSAKGNRAPAETMTGTVWLQPFETDSIAHWSAAKVTFEAGAHSNWHTHPANQVVVVADGVGYLKENGKPVQILRKGDVANILPGVLHWHGATPDSSFTQIVINPDIKNGVVNWLDRVTDEEYKNLSDRK